MAFKFTKQEETRRDALRDKLEEARAHLDLEVDAEIRIIEDAYAAINASFERYNEVLVEAQGFVEDIASEREGEFDDKSERWQEGERGDATRDWITTLQDTATDQLEPLEALSFEPPEMSFESHADILDNLPTEPEY